MCKGRETRQFASSPLPFLGFSFLFFLINYVIPQTWSPSPTSGPLELEPPSRRVFPTLLLGKRRVTRPRQLAAHPPSRQGLVAPTPQPTSLDLSTSTSGGCVGFDRSRKKTYANFGPRHMASQAGVHPSTTTPASTVMRRQSPRARNVAKTPNRKA